MVDNLPLDALNHNTTYQESLGGELCRNFNSRIAIKSLTINLLIFQTQKNRIIQTSPRKINVIYLEYTKVQKKTPCNHFCFPKLPLIVKSLHVHWQLQIPVSSYNLKQKCKSQKFQRTAVGWPRQSCESAP